MKICKNIRLIFHSPIVVLLSLIFSFYTLNVNAKAEEPVTVFAAASLKNALDEVLANWQEERKETVLISYASSGKLARQIEQGAPADIFISANINWVDYLIDKNAVDGGSKKILLHNQLALIAYDQNIKAIELNPDFDFKALIGDEYFALANVASVPAGIYGKSALEYFGAWKDIEPHVVQTENVRAALNLVLRGEAGFGITYKSDVQSIDGINLLSLFPQEAHEKIFYPVVKINKKSRNIAHQFYSYLFKPEAKKIFQSHGFEVE